jgi:carbon-monoxide dehydrogenase small subunit
MADDEKVTPEDPEKAPMKISRRDFLVGAGAGVVVTGAVAAGYIAFQPPKTVEVPVEVTTAVQAPPQAQATQAPVQEVVSQLIEGLNVITLNVNGRSRDLAISPETTLAEVLRRDLGLTGTHIGCNGSFCSACTVLVDGVAQNSCSLLAIREAGKTITTVEGLEQEGVLHPVQQAFWDQMGYQCGFCTSGQIMRTVELLSKTPKPTEEQIRRHMSGNMCKCSAYPNIVKAVQQAADAMA